MNPFSIFFLISILGLAWGTFTDFKERMVSNWLTWGMVIVGLLGHAVWTFAANDSMIFANSLGITIATFFFAYLLYRAGAWAGGDVKLFTGLAALNPFNPAILSRLGLLAIPAFGAINLPVFPLTLFIFSLFSMLPYGAFLAATRLLKNRKEKKKFVQDFKKKIMQSVEASALIVGLGAVLLLFGISQWLVLPLFFVASFLPKKIKAIASGIVLLAGLWINPAEAGMQFAAIFGLFVFMYLLFKLYTLSKVLMRKDVKVSELEEGMISAQTIVARGKKIEILPEVGIRTLIKYFAQNKSGAETLSAKIKEREIVSSRSAGGITEEEIMELKGLAKAKKIPSTLSVKESAPFVPAILIAYIVLNVVGDVIWVLAF